MKSATLIKAFERRLIVYMKPLDAPLPRRNDYSLYEVRPYLMSLKIRVYRSIQKKRMDSAIPSHIHKAD